MSKKISLIIIGLTLLFQSACTSVYIKKPFVLSETEKVDIKWCVHSSSEMNVVDSALSNEQNQIAFNKRINQAMDDISLRYKIDRDSSQKLVYQKLDQCEKGLITSSNTKNTLFLTLELSGYGSLKRKWKLILIGSGAVEAVVQGVLVTAATKNLWLGIAVAGEEMTSEYLTWNGVDWIFGETYAPVTLEGTLTYQNEIIWHDSFFVTENEDAVAKAERKNKSKQLIASLHLAEQKLFDSLSNYIKHEILNISNKNHNIADSDWDEIE